MDKRVVPWVLVPFFGYSSWVIVHHGYFGFLTLAYREPWAMQMLLDLVIALTLVASWMRRDARERAIRVTPYIVLLPFVGSISALAYLVHRSLVDARATNEG
ncbi:hypothetical protein AKJ09_04972 [Labilithrix luteola]|uniref:DUF2834 domain-containing protein n=1 Tax=Labilithrix luteola TaxID=1391654 RepID=A0A0K1PXR0_9BACT|nr:hypothetical protein [Labilithrix luteola]AKU98308.1 hypothetical protein AKJ09_04972 [Labilithrix luteola]